MAPPSGALSRRPCPSCQPIREPSGETSGQGGIRPHWSNPIALALALALAIAVAVVIAIAIAIATANAIAIAIAVAISIATATALAEVMTSFSKLSQLFQFGGLGVGSHYFCIALLPRSSCASVAISAQASGKVVRRTCVQKCDGHVRV